MKKKLVFTAPVSTASGYGTHARQLLRGLITSDKFDIYVEPIRWGETAFLTGAEVDWFMHLVRPAPQAPDISVQVSIPNEFKRRGKLSIGVTAGIEVDRVSPQWLLKCNSEVDLVVVPSEHSLRGFAVQYNSNDGRVLRLERPIAAVPEGVDTDIFSPAEAVSSKLDDLDVPEKNFICVGLGLDKANGRDRKNITRLVEWFCRAFAGREDVGLVLKTSIVNGSVIDFEFTKRRILDIKTSVNCGEFPKIFLLHGRMSGAEMAEIYNDRRIVAMVSPTHGEGFGLPLIEAAACGLPIVATDWSGHLDFLTKNGKKLFIPIEYDFAQVPQECVWEGVIEAGTAWADPREQSATSAMQKLLLSSQTPRKWAEELAAHIAENYRVEEVAKRFVDVVDQALVQIVPSVVRSRDDLISAMRSQIKEKGRSLVYTMPMSAGDVFLSTAVAESLKKRHPEHRLYFATSPQYFDIVKDHPAIDEIIEWMPWMQDVGVLEDVFDEVYTPNLAVQMAWSNWVHRGKGRPLLDEFATQCDVDLEQLGIPSMAIDTTSDASEFLGERKHPSDFIAVHAGGQKSARAYAHWTELVKNIRRVKKVVQVGAEDDISIGDVDVDLRGKCSYKETAQVLRNCAAFVGIDSFPMHVAACYGVPTVAIFGSSYASSTGPQYREARGRRVKLLETLDRHGCERACYKDVCKVDQTDPCINEIPPQRVWDALGEVVAWTMVDPKDGIENKTESDLELKERRWPAYQEHTPKLAGYTHILNPKTHGYPFFASITSMLGFCDEVIVVDGGSTDGSIEMLKAFSAENTGPIATGKLKIIMNKWDAEEPGMDGMQKAFGRAMVSSDVEFLWQQDADEVVHERDYKKIRDLCKRFPAGQDVMHLPVIELWGDQKTCRTDRHSWKWRLTRNNFRITHGINVRARRMDPKTGRFYAERGMSDGCELIDIVSGDHLPHFGFYNNELERLRNEDPQEYGRKMNEIFKRLPSVWHFSWMDLPRKIRHFKSFWDAQWDILYQTKREERFPDVKTDEDLERKAAELKERGGEHGHAQTFQLELEAPSI